jgi:peptidoglycan/xylan/chitin deacetylase (PgdA/CDA1 family)
MNQIPILMYHWFRHADEPSRSRSPQLEITPERFDRQLTLLRKRRYRTVPLSEALDPSETHRLAERRVVITFDDGTADFWDHARPALERHGFRATLFVVSGRVGGESTWDQALGEPARPLMSWEQIAQLHRDGHEIGSHTHTHRPFTEIDDDEVRDEALRSRETLGERLGVAPEFLAYPRGFHEERHKEIVRSAGYTGACAVVLKWGDLRRADPYALKRMTVKGDESLLRFRTRLALGRHIPLASV